MITKIPNCFHLDFFLFVQVVYVTAIFPYIVLLVLLIRGLTLPNSTQGIIYFLKPQWYRLGDAKVKTIYLIEQCDNAGKVRKHI